MSQSRRTLFTAAGAALLAGAVFSTASTFSTSVLAQAQPARQFEPEVGQAGKDVIWVPTPEALIERMLAMAKVTPADFVMDLGSGDGRTVIAAVKKGARAQGIEYNPDMVEHAKRRAKEAGVGDKAVFVRGDIFETDFSQATVITMYLLPELNLRLRPKLLDMKPGTRLVSHAFTMGDWDPDETATVEGRNAMLWIVPAKVGGNWTLRHAAGNGQATYDLAIQQTYQKVEGTIRQGAYNGKIEDGRMRADMVQFTFTDSAGTKRRFIGKVAGGRMEGALEAGNVANLKWTAERK